jgi:preprotein translocase subunit SecG
METVVIVIHLMVVVALIAVVLLQRSEGGALGIGGSSSFMTTRGQGNVLTRSTAILAGVFFATSIVLTVLARMGGAPTSILDVPGAAAPAAPGVPALPGGGLLDALPPSQLQLPPAATPAPAPAPGAAPEAPAAAPVTPAPAEAPAAPAVPPAAP